VTPVVVDASAFAALIFQEPEGDAIARRLDGATLFAPTLLRFELANTAWKKCARQPGDSAKILSALAKALEADIAWHDVDPVVADLVARATGLTAYDASYLCLAGSIGADLITLDSRLAAASAVVL